MSFKITCPHCGKEVEVEEIRTDAVITSIVEDVDGVQGEAAYTFTTRTEGVDGGDFSHYQCSYCGSTLPDAEEELVKLEVKEHDVNKCKCCGEAMTLTPICLGCGICPVMEPAFDVAADAIAMLKNEVDELKQHRVQLAKLATSATKWSNPGRIEEAKILRDKVLTGLIG